MLHLLIFKIIKDIVYFYNVFFIYLIFFIFTQRLYI
jgi:hypothetical protein